MEEAVLEAEAAAEEVDLRAVGILALEVDLRAVPEEGGRPGAAMLEVDYLRIRSYGMRA